MDCSGGFYFPLKNLSASNNVITTSDTNIIAITLFYSQF